MLSFQRRRLSFLVCFLTICVVGSHGLYRAETHMIHGDYQDGPLMDHAAGFSDVLPHGDIVMDPSSNVYGEVISGPPADVIIDPGFSNAPFSDMMMPFSPGYDGSVDSGSTTRGLVRQTSSPRRSQSSNTGQMSTVFRRTNRGSLESMMSDMMRNMLSQGGQGNFRYQVMVQKYPVPRSSRRNTGSQSRSSGRRLQSSFRLRQPGPFTRDPVRSRVQTFRDSVIRVQPETFTSSQRGNRFQIIRDSVSRGGGSVLPSAHVPTSARGSPTQFGLTDAHVRTILDKHNSARRELGAADMYQMHWDDQLAREANDWIQQCEMTHKGYGGRGENLAMVSGYGMDVNAVVDYGLNGWYNEKHMWQYGDGFSAATGHYTQMIWASSRLVGCAAKTCQGNTLYFFCFYSPQGNIMGQNPYQHGPACSACQGVCRSGLCD